MHPKHHIQQVMIPFQMEVTNFQMFYLIYRYNFRITVRMVAIVIDTTQKKFISSNFSSRQSYDSKNDRKSIPFILC